MQSVPVRFVHPLLRARDYQERAEYERLAEWWRERGAMGSGVCALVGIGGAGKTAIVERFLRRLPGGLPEDPSLPKDSTLPQPRRLFVFSFYDAPNPDTFFAELAAWLGGEPAKERRAVSYGETRSLLERAGPGLLVLDGLEKVQDDGARGILGQLQDGRLRDLVRYAAEGYLPGATFVLTTRFRPVDLLAQAPPFFREIDIEKLTAETAVTLLRTRGVRCGTDSDLARLAKEHGRHALTVDLLGGYIGTFCGGDPRTLPPGPVEIAAENPGLDPRTLALREQERKLARVSARYRQALRDKDPAALALLERVCLFRLGVSGETLAAIFLGWNKTTISGWRLATLGPRRLQAKLNWLEELRLLEAQPGNDETIYTVHPAVRDGIVRSLEPTAFLRGHQAAREELEAQLGERPGETNPSGSANLDLLEEIIYHALEAKLPQEAWRIYWDRIGGYKNLLWRLGAYERGDRICRAFASGRPPEAAPLPEGLYANQQAIFVNEWALYLKPLGRLEATVLCLQGANEIDRRQKNRLGLAIGNELLADVNLLAGRLVAGKRAAEEALALAERVEAAQQRCPSYACRGNARALLGESQRAMEDFEAALKWQNEREGIAEWRERAPLWSWGFWQAILLGRLGRSREAEQLTVMNINVLIKEIGRGSHHIPPCQLVLADLTRRRGDLISARNLESQAHDWAIARDAKELLCWAALVRAQIAVSAGQPDAAFRHSSEGLLLARDCGYGIFHIDLQNTLAESHLLASQPVEAERAARTALYGAADGDDGTPPKSRGTFPAPETGQPTLLAATHPECLYAWGEGDSRHLLGEALLLRAARSSDPAERYLLVDDALAELAAARALRKKILDPRARESSARLAETRQGVLLTHYPTKPTLAPEPVIIATTPVPIRDQVFISYSHKDKTWLEKLQVLLKPLMRKGALSPWDDTTIPPGAIWRDEIKRAVSRAKVAVLLVSPDFLASDFIDKEELPPLLAAAKQEGVPILWVYLRPCLYDETPIGEYQATHDLKQPLSGLSAHDQESVLLAVAKEIRRAAAGERL